jgi:uncharacterized Fe-S center protein
MGENHWMKKVVFFTDINKLHEALNHFDIQKFAEKKVPVKLHMGEIKNKHFSKPDFVKHVIDELKKRKSDPFLFDTTVAYPGLRHYVSGYHQVARIHGFTTKKIGCDVVIDDSGVIKTIENKEYEVAWHLINATHIFAITHVKGHVASGMGGAIKNFGMGGVTKETKRKMHRGSRPMYNKDACTYCGVCAEVCPFDAIKIKNETFTLNNRECFGCGVCIENCDCGALKNKDADFQYALACAAKACVEDKNVIYLNEVKRIAKSCDCDPFADPIICPDIGYLLSHDIVAVDKASLDLINGVKHNIFEKELKVNPLKQITFGVDIGLGSSSYSLLDL